MIEIRILGELEVKRDGEAVPLPPSRKSRALLGYLAATATAHRRDRLCELLWEGPDDPRGALRWSLAKLKPIVHPCLVAGRDRVELNRAEARIDAHALCTPATATTEVLEESAALFRGELLEGLDLPSCYRWQQWCAGERERLRRTALAILTELSRRLEPSPGALGWAQKRVQLDPFSDDAHAALIRLHAALGNPTEAMRQYESYRELLERELESLPSRVVEDARREITARRPARSAPHGSIRATANASPPAPKRPAFIGRDAELEAIDSAEGVVLLVGEPGIGKSRLLDEVRARRSGVTLYGRAYAAEMIRPFGVWLEGMADFPAAQDRAELFDAVVERLGGVELVAVDDLQWIDEASVALLHYVARKSDARVVCAARTGEIDDNAHALRFVQALKRSGRLVQISLGALTPEETRQLVSDERAARLSGGNPLFALELAHSGASGALSRVIASRIDQLDRSARELVSWAAAVGGKFELEIVGRATGMAAGEMLSALDTLERSTILRAAGERTYEFTHDLIRDAAYQTISGPRRALVHRHIARALSETHDPDEVLAGDLVHHASMAGDAPVAVSAAIVAGKRCLRLFAYAEAVAVARRGLQLAEELGEAERVAKEMELIHVIVMARTPVRERMPYAGRIAELIESARRLCLTEAAALGSHLLACLHQESNDYAGAAVATIRSAELGRTGDPQTVAFRMANTASCLLILQRDVDRAESLLREACAFGIANSEISLALGYLHAHRGHADEAVRHLEEAILLAGREGDHWRESIALFRLVTLALEEGQPHVALQRCARMRRVASKMTGGSEAVRSEVLECVARHHAGEAVDLDAAIARLRAIDSKADLAWVLATLASSEPDPARARAWANEALAAAEAVGRQSDAVIARKILRLPVQSSPDLSARARRFLNKEKSHGPARARADV